MKRVLSLLLSVILMVGLVTVNAVPVSAESDFVISDECVELLKAMEGFDKYPRWDYSQWTVGHGTRCPDEDLERYRAYGISYEEADALLRQHAGNFGKSINSFIDKYDLDYNQNQFDALLLFTYNFGNAWLFREGSWRTGLINGVTGNDFMYEIGQWCHAGGSILKPLITRRLIEANIFFNGIYSRTAPDNYCYVIFEFNGGEGETDVQAYNSDMDAPIRVIPTREGYTFAGWYTANEGGTKVTSLDRSTKNITLYARWVEGEDPSIEEEPPVEEPPVEEPDDSNKIDPVTVTVTGNEVNVRTGPGTNYSVVDRVNSGETLTITEVQTGSGYTWGKFDTNSWIALMYTDYDKVTGQQPDEDEPAEPPIEEAPVEPPVEETPEEPPVEETPEEKGVKGIVTGSDLRIRSGAGTNYSILGLLQIGDRVIITERKTVGSMEWGKMEKGWISLTYVMLDEPAQEEKPEEVVPEKPEPAPSEPGENESDEITGKVKVNDYLRIRNGSGTNYTIVGYYGPNAAVTILETKTVDGTIWGRTNKGWISLDYVVLDRPLEMPEEDSKAINGTVDVDDVLRVRSGPGVAYSIVGFLNSGDRVTITETKTVGTTTWGKISNGWISMDYVIIN